jgi:molecular chaperone DnaJ
MKDHYATLGVERTASKEEIKSAYRKLSMAHHPDKGGDENKFKDINEAYSILHDDNKRQQYDNPNPFQSFFSGMGGPFGGARPKPQKPDLDAPRDGQFIGVEAEIPVRIFLFGGKYNLKLSYHEGCVDCGGKGFTKGEECSVCNGECYVQQVQRRPGFMSSSMQPCPSCQARGMVGTDKCDTCNGRGNVLVQDKEFEFELPPGCGPGTKRILSGAGRTGLNGGRRGDVGIIVVGLKHPDLNKLTPEQVEELKSLLEVLDNANESA